MQSIRGFIHSLTGFAGTLMTAMALSCLLLEQTTQAVNVPTGAKTAGVHAGKVLISSSHPLSSAFHHTGTFPSSFHHTAIHAGMRGLPVLADGAMALPSNANNFHGQWNATVNPRTGNAAFSMKVAGALYDHGKTRRDLELAYAGSATAGGPDPFGLGPHWRWNVGSEHPSTSEVAGHMTTDIVTGDGHAFTMESERDASGQTLWRPLRHKLEDVKITGSPGNWTIALITGLKEHIAHGYEDWEESQDGHRFWFYYDHEGSGDVTRHLKYLCSVKLDDRALHQRGNACAGHGIWIEYEHDRIRIHGQQTLTVETGQSGNLTEVTGIVMPSLSSEGISNHDLPASVHFAYDGQGNRPWLLRTVKYPGGRKITFLYNEEAGHDKSQSLGLPVGINGAYLPVVTGQIIHAGSSSIPDRHLWYHYGSNHASAHNYTGYQGGAMVVPGRDNLLDRPDSYTYRVAVDNGLVRTTTTYNKYHLPLEVIREDLRHHGVFSEESSDYEPWKNTVFSSLSPTFSLPRGKAKTYYTQLENGTDRHFSIQLHNARRYNAEGQVIWQRDARGQQTFTTYCPVSGDSHCPAMDATRPRLPYPEKILVVPPAVAVDKLAGKAKAFEQIYDYSALAVVTGDHRQQGMKATAHLSRAASKATFWQMTKKTRLVLDRDRVSGLQPGQALPEETAGKVSERVSYGYDRQKDSPSYGELTRLMLSRPHKVRPSSYGLKTLMDEESAQQPVIFDVIHHLDSRHGIRTTTIRLHRSPVHDGHFPARIQAGMAGINLGTRQYSVSTGVKLSADDALKTVHSVWHYDLWNRPVEKVVTPVSGGKPHVTRWHYIITPREKAVVKTFPDGSQQKVVYGEDRQILSVWHRFRGQAGATMEGCSNWMPDQRYTYTVNGHPASMTRWHAGDMQGGQSGEAIALTTWYGYDSLGRPVWTRHPDGQVMVTARDDASLRQVDYEVATGDGHGVEKPGPFLKVTDSDMAGKPVAVYVLPLDAAIKKAGVPLYSPALKKQLQSLLGAMLPVSSLRSTGSFGLLPLGGHDGLLAFVRSAIQAGAWLTHTRSSYDGSGHLVRHEAGNGAVTRWQWDGNTLEATITPDGRRIHDEFDLEGQKISRCVQLAGQSVCHVLGRRGFDAEGNLLWKADEYGHVVRYRYDRDGRRLGMTVPFADGSGGVHVFAWQYNSLGVTEASVDGKTYARYGYDPKTWQLTDQEDRISHRHYVYDPDSGELTGMVRTAPVHLAPAAGIHYPGGTETFRYDRYHQPVLYTDSDGNRYWASHDRLGRVVSSWVRLKGQNQAIRLELVHYDLFGRAVNMRNGGGITRTVLYNGLGQLLSTTDRRQGELLQRLSYRYDADTGNVTGMTRQEGAASATETFDYDLINNLTGMRCHATGKPGTTNTLCPRDIDMAGRSGKPLVIMAQHYHFDGWNNIDRVDETLMTQSGQGIAKTVRYSYAKGQDGSVKGVDPHRLVAMSTHWSDGRASTRPVTLGYDELGRMVRDGQGNRLYYNAFGRQVRFENVKTGETVRYHYDSDGHQVAEQPFDGRGRALQLPLYLFYAGDRVVAHMQSDNRGRRHVVRQLGGVARCEDGVITRWKLHNYKGDVISSFSPSGKRLEDNLYSPYGMRYDLNDSEVQRLPQALAVGGQGLLWQRYRPGFDGQMTDPATGYQFLGGGYRAYNPVYRHFMSKDSFSPFAKMDGYGFGDNNPVMNLDPSGHLPRWMGFVLGGLTMGLSITLGLLVPVASFVTCSGAISLASLVFGGITAGSGLLAGSLQMVSTVYPGKMGLALTSDIMGALNGFFPLFMGPAFIIFGGFRAALSQFTGASSGLLFFHTTLLILSSIAATLSGGINIASSVMKISDWSGQNFTRIMELKSALKIMGAVSIGLMAFSIIMGLGAGIGMVAEGINARAQPRFSLRLRIRFSGPINDNTEEDTASLDETSDQGPCGSNVETISLDDDKPLATSSPEQQLNDSSILRRLLANNEEVADAFYDADTRRVIVSNQNSEGVNFSARALNKETIIRHLQKTGVAFDRKNTIFYYYGRNQYNLLLRSFQAKLAGNYDLILDMDSD